MNKKAIARQKFNQCYQLLAKGWRNFQTFAIDKSENHWYSKPETAFQESKYAQKLRFYAYLPVIEEQRDWLEKIYSL
jgi:hypothetical protein